MVAREYRPRIHYRCGRRRSLRYRNLFADRCDLRIRAALACLVHRSIHDCHSEDVRQNRDGHGKGSCRRYLRALLVAMASSAQMLIGLPFLFWLILITGSIIILEVFVPYRTYSKILKYLALTLFSYVLAALVVRLDWGMVFHATLVPHL